MAVVEAHVAAQVEGDDRVVLESGSSSGSCAASASGASGSSGCTRAASPRSSSSAGPSTGASRSTRSGTTRAQRRRVRAPARRCGRPTRRSLRLARLVHGDQRDHVAALLGRQRLDRTHVRSERARGRAPPRTRSATRAAVAGAPSGSARPGSTSERRLLGHLPALGELAARVQVLVDVEQRVEDQALDLRGGGVGREDRVQELRVADARRR